MRIAVLGLGSIGSLVLSTLCKVDNLDLVAYGRGEHTALAVHNGLVLKGHEEYFVNPGRVEFLFEEAGVPEQFLGCCDYAIICSKAAQVADLAVVAQSILSKDGICFTLANGLGHVEGLELILGRHRVVAAITTHGAYRDELASVTWAGKGKIEFAQTSNGPSGEELQDLIEVLELAGLNPIWNDDWQSMIWQKVLINIAVNPTAALAGLENGALLQESMFSNCLSTMLEGACIARSLRVNLPDDSQLEEVLRNVLVATSSNICSMLQDVKAGRVTEIQYLNRAVSNLGEELGIATPLNSQLAALVESIQP